ncbi:hypothetical protein ACGYK8_18555 [Sulfitobacter sp. 1A09149]|uniref:hypothetical protein n=1 Tax=Sulfitobacter sp. 1A09149 TaxID=3368584 RepID=UPI00374597E3
MKHAPYFVDVIGSGEPVDVMPYVIEAMASCPYRHDFTPIEIAKLLEQVARGKYISVDVLDRIEGRMLDAITGRVIRWLQTEQRIAQLTELMSYDIRYIPYVEVRYFKDDPVCAGVEKLSGRWLRQDELVRFPLPDCDQEKCSCGYRAWTKHSGRKRHPTRSDPF